MGQVTISIMGQGSIKTNKAVKMKMSANDINVIIVIKIISVNRGKNTVGPGMYQRVRN